MQMSHQERVERLKSMLNQVAGEGGLEAVETPVAFGLEVMADGAAPADVAANALEKLKSGQPISPAEAGALEAIVLPDKRPVVFIRDGVYGTVPMAEWSYLNNADVQKRINASIPSIGRVELPLTPSIPYGGTAFVVAPDLLMTNRHVARLFAEGLGTRLKYHTGGSAIDFKREIDSPVNGAAVLTVSDVVMIHPFWDMALLKVVGLPSAAQPLSLAVTAPEDLLDEDVVVVGYPAQDYRNDAAVQNQVFGGQFGVKRLAPGKTRKRELIQSFENHVSAMTHDSSTLGGNSGSAVIQVKTGKVVGLHFAGEYLKANYSVPTYELARDQRIIDAGVNFDGAVAVTNDWLPAWKRADATPETAAPAGPLALSAAGNIGTHASGAVSFVVPLQLTISIGSPTLGGAPAVLPVGSVATAAAEVEKVPVIYPDMSSRKGYQSDFLNLSDGVTVPMPTLTAAGKTVAARLDDGSYELKYHKFSIVLHKSRRLALFTAANVDWRDEKRRIGNRKPSRKELNGFTGNEREDWVIDPRVPLDNQLPDYFYSHDANAFDRGHLVRRDDVSWGESFEDMQKGNGDTFHTTNCSPQTAEFNRPAELNWGALEQMVENQTKAEKVCVFSGPVLDDSDGYFHGKIKSGVPVSIQIPAKFWKVIIANVQGKPAVYSFVLDQDLSGVDLYAELAIPDAWKNYLRPLAEIESYFNGKARFAGLEQWDQFGKI